MKPITRLYIIPIILFTAFMLLTGCSFNDGNAGGIAGMHLWLDANEGTEFFPGTSFLKNWENLADPDHDLYAYSQTISINNLNMSYFNNTYRYVYFTGSGMQSPMVLGNSNFTVVIAGNVTGSGYLLTIPTRDYGDVNIGGNGSSQITVYAMGSTWTVSSYTSGNCDVYFFIFRRNVSYLSTTSFNLNSMSSGMYDFPLSSSYYPSSLLTVGNTTSYIADIMIFDHALSNSEINKLSSYFRKKYNM